MKRTTKEIAGRIEPTYHRVWHRLRRTRTLLSAAFVIVGIAWAVMGGSAVHSNGPVSGSHASFEDDCAQCHGASFEAVSDESCSECHVVSGHQDAAAQSASTAIACAQCHREHRGRTGLAQVADAHCNTCHADHGGIRRLYTHAEFEVKPREQNIRFDHATHLQGKLVGGPMDCADCHQPEGEGHRPIRFDAHCARCHTERLDADIADETVPHGVQPDKLKDWIAAVYLRRMRADNSLVQSTETDEMPTWAEALTRRSERALRGLIRPGSKQGCLICHTMAADRIVVPSIPSGWPNNWHRSARFTHVPHKSTACSECHDMRSNTTAADLSLPGVASCRECHQPDAVANSCVTCHPYHRQR